MLNEDYTEATVLWDDPDDDGGSPVTRYVVEYKPAADETWVEYTNYALQNSIKLMGLKENTKYMVRIYAQNMHGNGPTSPAYEFSTKKQTGKFGKNISGNVQRLLYIDHYFIEALHVTYYTVNMADCSSPFKRSVITTYHHSLSPVYQMHWYQSGQ